ncbi:hypothetical protein XENOCAPTIV_011478 [Xenoophorus captivus]|uniref:Uncharacterized protein n=1 Tax=Xenoophorus captivus TaxID=1517983 RepID=A0ABV0QS22_9TELE
MWEEAKTFGENPHMHEENMQTSCRSPGQDLNPGPSNNNCIIVPKCFITKNYTGFFGCAKRGEGYEILNITSCIISVCQKTTELLSLMQLSGEHVKDVCSSVYIQSGPVSRLVFINPAGNGVYVFFLHLCL